MQTITNGWGMADAIISGDKWKENNTDLRELADAIISGDKWKASGRYRDLADAIISGDKWRV